MAGDSDLILEKLMDHERELSAIKTTVERMDKKLSDGICQAVKNHTTWIEQHDKKEAEKEDEENPGKPVTKWDKINTAVLIGIVIWLMTDSNVIPKMIKAVTKFIWGQ